MISVASQKLLEIADLLEREPALWCKQIDEDRNITAEWDHSEWRRPNSRCPTCLWGWVLRRVPRLKDREEVTHRIARVIGTVFLTDWNDVPERTVAQVVDVCRKAAA